MVISYILMGYLVQLTLDGDSVFCPGSWHSYIYEKNQQFLSTRCMRLLTEVSVERARHHVMLMLSLIMEKPQRSASHHSLHCQGKAGEYRLKFLHIISLSVRASTDKNFSNQCWLVK